MNIENQDIKEKPLVSVIIPTYNRAELLKEALDSVYGQEGVGMEFEMEVIVVDNGSSNAKAVAEIAGQYPRVSCIRLETNRGVSAARNVGIKASKGKYVAFLDDDDLFLPNRLRLHIPVLEANPEVGAVYSQLLITGVEKPFVYPDVNKAPSGWVFHHFLMEGTFFMQFATIRKGAFEVAGLFDENLRIWEDYDICLRLSFHFPFVFVPRVVFIYRFSEEGEWCRKLTTENYEETASYILDKILAMLPETSEALELKKRASLYLFSMITSDLKKFKKVEQLRNHIRKTLKNNPWILQEQWAWSYFVDSMCALAFISNAIIRDLRAFYRELIVTAHGLGRIETREMRQMFAKAWMTVGSTLMENRLPKFRRPAGYATIYAVFNDLTLLREKYVWKRLVRGFILSNSCWDPIIDLVK
jgi:glycosyltransferase involved in cell wall biosynthesis